MISIAQFINVMRLLKARKVEENSYYTGKDNPTFEIKGIYFRHSGKYFICTYNKEIPVEIREKAKEILGDKGNRGVHFWYGEIHTVLGLVTVVTMINNNYTQEYVNSIIDKVYQKLFKAYVVNKKINFKTSEYSIEKITVVLEKFHRITNPLLSKELKLINPNLYENKLKLWYDLENTSYGCITLKTDEYFINFKRKNKKWAFRYEDDENESIITHYYDPKEYKEEILFIRYYTKNENSDISTEYRLNLGLQTGSILDEDKKMNERLISQIEIDLVIQKIEQAIRNIEENIISQITI